MGSHPPGVVSATHFPAIGSCPAAGHLDAVTAPSGKREIMLPTCSASSDLITTVSGVTQGILGMAGDSTLGAESSGKSERTLLSGPLSSMGGLRETPLYPHNNPPSLPLRTAGAHPICTGNTTQPPPLTASCLRLKAFLQSPLSFTTSLKGPPPPALFPRSQQPSAGP